MLSFQIWVCRTVSSDRSKSKKSRDNKYFYGRLQSFSNSPTNLNLKVYLKQSKGAYMEHPLHPDMTACRLCPRHCGVDRTNGQTGVCGMPDTLYISRCAPHLWEEPPISGMDE